MKKISACLLMLATVLIGGAASAYEIEFFSDTWRTNGIAAGGYLSSNNSPTNWVYTSASTTFSIMPNRSGLSGKNALQFKFYNETKGRTAQLRMGADLCVPSSEIVCDNIAASMMLYVQPVNNKTIDSFQFIATTNDWDDVIAIGDAIPIRDASYETGWRTFTVNDTLPGISQHENSLRIGVLATAGGTSMTYGYLHSLSIAFRVCASPTDPLLVNGDAEELTSVIVPGLERGRMVMSVNVSPEDKVGDLTVYGVLSRYNGTAVVAVTNALEKSDGLYHEDPLDAAKRLPFDAGEIISVSAFSKYKSTDATVLPLGEVGADGFAYEYSGATLYSVGKFGSAWVNELGVMDGVAYVELCGTTNRAYLSGWQVVLTGETSAGVTNVYTTTFAQPFNFATNMVDNGCNGVVGIETHRLNWDGVPLSNAKVELKNAAGVVEFVSNNMATWPAHYQMVGTAIWRGSTPEDWSYDWAGTSTNGTFAFEASADALSLGQANVGQSFLAPISNMLYTTVLIGSSSAALADATVSVTVDGILNGSEGTTNFIGQTAAGTGTAAIGITGYSADAHSVPMTIAVSAFAWKCDAVVTNVSLYGDIVLTNYVSSTVAYDDFSELKPYWSNESNIKNSLNVPMYWGTAEVSVDGRSESVLQLDTRNGIKGEASLTTKGYMDLRGKRYLDISFDFRNEVNSGTLLANCTTLNVIISDTADFSGTTIETLGLATKNANYGKEEWYSFKQFVEEPEGFADDGRVWIRIMAAKSTGTTSAYTMLDNLRVAAQDSVKIDALNVPGLKESGCPAELVSAAQLDLSPLTGGIVSNVEETVTGYTATTNGVDAGTFATRTEYEDFLANLTEEVELTTVTNINRTLLGVTTNSVKAVAADLMMTINGNEFTIPFQYSGEDWADALTNDISAVHENVTLTIAPEAITAITGGFLPGDEVSYYARVTYDPDDADASGARDVRYYPDNTTATESGWYVKGGYGVSSDLSAQSFTVPGPDVSAVGEPTVTTDGITWMAHAYSEQGFTNLTATVTTTSGTSVRTDLYSGASTNRWTGSYTFNDLVPNTEYTITIAGSGANGDLTAMVKTLVTLPLAPTVTFTALSTSVAQLTMSGSAEDYEVAGWTQTAAKNVWTKSGLTPNTEVSATVVALNKAGGKSAATSVSGYTLAAAATMAPVIEKGVTSVQVSAAAVAEGAFNLDGNPTNTEYAVRVTTSSGRDALVTTVVEADGALTTNELWRTLADWTHAVEVTAPTIDLEATNFFSFVTRNFATPPVCSTNEPPVTTNCYFAMTSAFVDGKATQKADQTLNFALTLSDPAQGAGAKAEVEISLDGGTTWKAAGTPFDVAFNAISVTTDAIAINAWELVNKTAGEYDYTLRARVVSANGGRASEWTTVSGSLDFAPPTDLAITGTPAAGAITKVTGYDFTFSATDTQNTITYNWDLDGATGTGASKSGSGLADGKHTLSVTATDAMGNTCAAVTRTWTVDTIQPVWSDPAISGTPAAGTNTTASAYDLTAAATDDTSLTYHWTLGEKTATGATFTGEVAADGVYTALVYAVDAAGNSSTTNAWVWTRDTAKPAWDATTPISGTPAKDALTNVAAFNLTASLEDVSSLTYHWTLNGVAAAATGATFTGTGVEGTNTVSVYATDVAGNDSDVQTWSWTLDTTPPTALSIGGLPAQPTATRSLSLSATATDLHTPITYSWSLNGGAASAGATFTTTGAIEGTNKVVVTATDKAGNATTKTGTWVLDTRAPTDFVLSGTPAENAITNKKQINLVAAATDLTTVTYRWTLGDETFDVTNLVTEATTDGVYTVSVTATDVVGNTTVTNRSWTLDTMKPANVAISGVPTHPTNVKSVTLTASATDARGIAAYTWTFGGKTSTGMTCTFEAVEGANTVTLTATDVAGNVSDAATCTWIYDTQAPTDLEFLAASVPAAGAVVATTAFDLAVTAKDATALTYGWTLNGTAVGCTASNYVSSAAEAASEGTNTVSVVATDVTGNSCAPATWTWVVDLTAPSMPAIVAGAAPLALTENRAVDLTVAAEDATRLTYHWALNGVFAAETGATFTCTSVGADGDYALSVYATDEAGNVSPTNSWSWTLDTTPPTGLAIGGVPAGATAEADRTLTALATDAHGVTYAWTVNGASRTGAAIDVHAIEGTNRVSVVASDAAGNSCAAVAATWVLDTQAPTLPVVTGTPANGVVTNVKRFEFAAKAEDATALAYHWLYGEETVDGETLARDIDGDGVYTVKVYATDAAHNVSATNTVSWTLDTTPPTATLSTAVAEDHVINLKESPFAVKVTFSEPVTNFTAGAVTVANGTVSNVTELVAEETATNSVWQVLVMPAADGEVSVSVAAGVVTDAAGNANTAATVAGTEETTLTRTCDITPPTVTLGKPSASYYNAANLNKFTAKVTFSEVVTDFTAAAVTVGNGTVSVTGSGTTYTVSVVSAQEGMVTLQINADRVTDAAGNGNVASEMRSSVYDATDPTASTIAVENRGGNTYALTATSTDANPVKYVWFVKGVEATDLDYEQQSGTPNPLVITITESVNVYALARDAATNWADEDASKANAVTLEFNPEEGKKVDVDFAGGVIFELVDAEGQTNQVEFTLLDFQPGAECTFKLRTFKLAEGTATPDFSKVAMWFVVQESLGGTTEHVAVEPSSFDAATGELTVKLPAEATTGKKTLFIRGIDNSKGN